eukprot:GHRR01001409.1.p1 GENE.GHRR01001409.1~~GHRR01001409.1.p1  ORF type:complete len:353 (+),score=149.86 GHRR01001409.1:257-1315(+)
MNVAGLVRPNTDDFSVFVGDLAPDVTDYVLQETFRQYYPSVRSAKVIVDPATGRSKGYGFVRFANEAERDRSLEMQGFQLSNRPIRVSLATARRSSSAGMPGTHPAELDPTNTTLFIGGLSAGVTEEQLRAIFMRYGDVVYTKIPQGKGCGFVQFVNRNDAEVAMAEMNGQVVGSSAIRISWGRSTSRTAALQAQQQQQPLGALGGGYGSYTGMDPYGAAAGLAAQQASSLYNAGAGAGAAAGAAAPAGYNLGLYGGLSAGFPANSNASLTMGAAQGYNSNALAALQLQQSMATTGLTSAQLLAAATGGLQQQQPQQQQVYDPLAGVDINKLNALFMQRQQQGLTGAFMRPM